MVLLVPLLVVLVGAWSYRWVQEDAFINFRIINNLLAGHGPVFNVGERVEAYSDPLWLFLVAGMHEVLPFITIEWLSICLGLAGTAIGVVLAGRAVQRLAGGRDGGVTLPVGLLIFSVVAGVWEFATSGLEMGMVFCWVGLGFWLLVRTEERRESALWCAFVLGLGTLIRPELLLMSIVELGALAVVVAAAGWKGPSTDHQALPGSGGSRHRRPRALRALANGLLRLARVQHCAGQVSHRFVVVPRIHLRLELRRPLHPLATLCPGRSPGPAAGSCGGGDDMTAPGSPFCSPR